MYHFHFSTPTTSSTIDGHEQRERRDVPRVPAAPRRRRAAATASRSRSMSRTGLISGFRFTRRAYHITYAIITAVPTTHVTSR